MTAAFRERYRVGLLCAAVVILLCAWIITLSAMPPMGRPAAGPGTALVDTGTLELGISGTLAVPLSPGGSGVVDLDFTNNHSSALVIRDIIVTVVAVDAPRSTATLPCTVKDFAVAQSTASFTLAPGRTASLSESGVTPDRFPTVGMLDTSTNQDGCVAASLTLGFRAVGEEQR